MSHGEGWIGYVELGYALHAKPPTVSLRAPDASYVSPTVQTIAVAAAHAKVPNDLGPRSSTWAQAPGRCPG